MASIEQALVHLAAKGEQGFAHFDAPFGIRLAERVRVGVDLTAVERRSAARLLDRYRELLAGQGLDLPDPPGPMDAPGITPQVVHDAEPPAPARPTSVQAYVNGEQLFLVTPYALRELAEEIPGGRWSKYVKPSGARVYAATPATAHSIATTFAGHDLQTDQRFLDLAAAFKVQSAAAEHKSAQELPEIPGETLQSWLHQRQAYWFARDLPACVLAMGMGTGKSKVTVDLLRTNNSQTTLILCPKRVVGVWPKQFDIHAPGVFHVITGRRLMKTGVRKGRWALKTVSERTAEFDEALHECRCGKPHVIIANYEVTAHSPFKVWAFKQRWNYAVLDESHRIRSPQGTWSAWCTKLRPHTTRRLLLSGTVMGQTPLDAFAQYRFADPGIFGTSNTSFQKRYAIVTEAYHGAGTGPGDPKKVVALRIHPRLPDGRKNRDYDPELAKDFDARLFSIMYEVDSDVLDLPESLTVTHEFELPSDVQRVYDQIDEEMFAIWRAHEMSAADVHVKML